LNNISLNPRRLFLIGVALAALVAGTLALISSLGAQPSRAAVNDNQITCKGFIKSADANPDDPDLYQAQYRIRCDQAITGYSLFIGAQQVEQIETETVPLFADGSVVAADAFSCNGDLPGNGVNCIGKYSDTSGIITGTFAVAEPLCTAGKRIEPILTVAKASVSSANAAVLAISGPFSLGQPSDCKGKKNKPRTMPLMPKPEVDEVETGEPGYTGPVQDARKRK
jgi:hypothetical protein